LVFAHPRLQKFRGCGVHPAFIKQTRWNRRDPGNIAKLPSLSSEAMQTTEEMYDD
jgi:hypothetical protein